MWTAETPPVGFYPKLNEVQDRTPGERRGQALEHRHSNGFVTFLKCHSYKYIFIPTDPTAPAISSVLLLLLRLLRLSSPLLFSSLLFSSASLSGLHLECTSNSPGATSRRPAGLPRTDIYRNMMQYNIA